MIVKNTEEFISSNTSTTDINHHPHCINLSNFIKYLIISIKFDKIEILDVLLFIIFGIWNKI